MSTIPISSKTSLPIGAWPSNPIGSPLFTPNIMLIGSSYVTGGSVFGDTIGNSYQLMLHQYLVSCGVTPTWKGLFIRGTAPADHHQGSPGSKLLDHATGGSVDSVARIVSLAPIDLAIIDLQVNDMNDDITGDPATFQANYITLGTQCYNAGAPRIMICMMNAAGDAARRARFVNCWPRYGAIKTGIEAAGALVHTADLRVFTNDACLNPAEAYGSRLHPNDAGYMQLAATQAPHVLNACGHAQRPYGVNV